MESQEVAELSKRRHVRQPPSVPFMWEERPGVTKKDWKPETCAVMPVLTPQLKLIASVPFSWEEKPGKPISVFSESQNITLLPTTQTCFLGYESLNYSGDDGGLESFRFGTYDSFSSASSVLTNCLEPSGQVPSAVQGRKPLLVDSIDQSEDISSPDSDSDSDSSYATGVSSLAGTEFLECLFPLYSQNTRDFDRAILNLPIQNSSDSYLEQNSSVVLTRPQHTLGELIMMSRRRSYQRKAVEMARHNLSMKLRTKKEFGCFIIGTSPQMI